MAALKQRFKLWWERFSTNDIKSSKSRSILLYLGFVLISAILWCFLTFNNIFTIDLQMPVRVIGTPDNVRFISNVPDTISVSVNDKGSAFVKYMFKPTPVLELRFTDYASADGVFKVDAAQLKKLILRKLLRGSTVSSVLPDNINAKYTDGPGIKVPVVVDIEVEPELLYMQNYIL